MSESMEQILFVNWFRRTHKGVRIFHIANGGKRGKAEAGRLKNEGVTAGVPDLCIPEWKLWIEMKDVDSGVLSPDQKDWLEYLRSIGYSAEVAHGFEEAKKVVEIALALR